MWRSLFISYMIGYELHWGYTGRCKGVLEFIRDTVIGMAADAVSPWYAIIANKTSTGRYARTRQISTCCRKWCWIPRTPSRAAKVHSSWTTIEEDSDKGTRGESLPMKVLALNGSPRKGGNTEILVDAALAEAGRHGHAGRKLRLYDYRIEPCVDCRACKKGELKCVLKDNMPKIYAEIDAADALILATPIYWYGPTAKMKLLIDRLRPYVANRKLEGKKAYLIAPSEEGPSACAPLVDSLKLSYKYLGLVYSGEVLATANEVGEVAGNPDEVEKALRLLDGL